jgi:hypothetical protein
VYGIGWRLSSSTADSFWPLCPNDEDAGQGRPVLMLLQNGIQLCVEVTKSLVLLSSALIGCGWAPPHPTAPLTFLGILVAVDPYRPGCLSSRSSSNRPPLVAPRSDPGVGVIEVERQTTAYLSSQSVSDVIASGPAFDWPCVKKRRETLAPNGAGRDFGER